MELAAKGENLWALREMAKIVISKALKGDTAMIGVIADRIDGKAAQVLAGNDDLDPIRIEATDEQRAQAVASLLAKTNGRAHSDTANDD